MVVTNELPNATCYNCGFAETTSSFTPIFSEGHEIFECPECGSSNVELSEWPEGDDRNAD